MNTQSFRKSIAWLVIMPLFVVLAACKEKPKDGVEASGMVETTDVTISAQTAGKVQRIRVREGDKVSTGDTLFVIDNADLVLQRDQLVAAADVARAQFDGVRNGSRVEDIGQSNEVVRQAQLSLESAKDDVKRYEELFRVGAIPEKTLADAKTRQDLATRQYNAVRLNYEKVSRGSRREDIDAAHARVSQAEAQIQAIDKKIADCIVLAPVDGTVTTKSIEAGEFVNVGTGVVTVSQTDPVKIKIYVAEDELGKVKLGQPADLVIDTYQNKHYSGKVTYISPTAEFTPKNVQTKEDRVKLVFEVWIQVPNAQGDLKAGLIADARLLEPGVAATQP